MTHLIVWLLTILGGLAMFSAGLSKFLSTNWQVRFTGWGYPAWFALVIGALEIGGAIALFIPRLALYAAMLLAAIMVGAVYTVVANASELGWHAAAIQLAIMSLIAAIRFSFRDGRQVRSN